MPLRQRMTVAVAVAVAVAVLLAAVLDGLILLVQRAITPWTRATAAR